MPLTDVAIRKAKAPTKITKMYDGDGLYLELSPSGGKWWRWRYRIDNREKRLSLGVYPDVGLREARDRCDDVRKQLAKGIDPSHARRAQKASLAGADTFEVIAREWHAKFSPRWVAVHADRLIRRLELDVFPYLGKKLIVEMKGLDILKVAERVAHRGALETAHRVIQNCGQVFRYAVATGRVDRDPTGDLRGSLMVPKKRHLASITDPRKVGELLRAIDAYKGSLPARCALRLAPLVFVRPGELRQAQWGEFDFEKAEWRIPAERMKMKVQHIVPLSQQAIDVLRELEPTTNRPYIARPNAPRYLFPGGRSRERPMSNNAVLAALRSMGYVKDEMTGHGFRSMASTLSHEMGWNHQAIERQLAHAERNEVSAAYNFAEYLPERRKMMQAWADYLDTLKADMEIRSFAGTGT